MVVGVHMMHILPAPDIQVDAFCTSTARSGTLGIHDVYYSSMNDVSIDLRCRLRVINLHSPYLRRTPYARFLRWIYSGLTLT